MPEDTATDSGTLVGLGEAERPDGEVVVRVMVPLNPFNPDTAIVDVPGVPAWTESEEGFAEMLKSTTVTVTVTECESDPLFPVTVTE